MFYNDIFDKYTFLPEKAAECGFENRGDCFLLRRALPESGFYAELRVTEKSIEANVFEEPDGEEYMPFNAAADNGGFASTIRAYVREVVDEVVESCFALADVKAILLDYVREKYGTIPEAPWKALPEYHTLKTPRKKKWYGLFMLIPYSYLKIKREGKINVLNLKIKTEDIPKVVDRVHYFPAYHMNKKYWISIVLDRTADIPFIEKLLDASYGLVEGKT